LRRRRRRRRREKELAGEERGKTSENFIAIELSSKPDKRIPKRRNLSLRSTP